MDIWLKSAKPSALLKDPLPKGSKVPKGPASNTNRGRITGHPGTSPGVKGKCHLSVPNSPRCRRSREVVFLCWSNFFDRVEAADPLGQEGR